MSDANVDQKKSNSLPNPIQLERRREPVASYLLIGWGFLVMLAAFVARIYTERLNNGNFFALTAIGFLLGVLGTYVEIYRYKYRLEIQREIRIAGVKVLEAIAKAEAVEL